MANIVVETRLESLPYRKVLLNFKFVNQDNIDYYFNTKFLCSPYFRGLAVNNTWFSPHTTDGWTKCSSMCSPPPQPEDMVKIPANGIGGKTVDIVSICHFLYSQSLGKEHYFRYTHSGGSMALYDIGDKWIDTLIINRIELPFMLHDEESEEEEEEEIETIEIIDTILDSVIAGATAESMIGVTLI